MLPRTAIPNCQPTHPVATCRGDGRFESFGKYGGESGTPGLLRSLRRFAREVHVLFEVFWGGVGGGWALRAGATGKAHGGGGELVNVDVSS